LALSLSFFLPDDFIIITGACKAARHDNIKFNKIKDTDQTFIQQQINISQNPQKIKTPKGL
jgi:hypothetical protein